MRADLGEHQLRGAEDHPPGRAVHRDRLPTLDHPAVGAEPARLRIHVDALGAHHTRLPHAARDNRGVAGHPAPRGQDRLRGDDAVEVLR